MNMNEFTAEHAKKCQQVDTIDKDLYLKYGVKRGLRDLNGQGVLTGLTNISNVVAFKQEDGQRVPCDGQLWYPRIQCGRSDPGQRRFPVWI